MTKAKAGAKVADKGTPARITMVPIGATVAGTRASQGWQVEAEGQRLIYATTEAMLKDVNDYIANPNAFRERVSRAMGL